MSFNKHRHAEYTSKSRHYFQNSISKFGRSAARDDYFAPDYGQKSPELGGTAAGAYSGYSDQEIGSERDDFRCASRRPNEIDRYKSRSKHAFHHYKDGSTEESSGYRIIIIQYQHKESSIKNPRSDTAMHFILRFVIALHLQWHCCAPLA